MVKLVVNGANLKCSMGASPSSLSALPDKNSACENQPAATVQDMKPNVNIMPFGMCRSPANPQVAAATSAANGVLTPQPCIPATSAPWTPGSAAVIVANQAALTADSKCTCQWGGVIEITNPASQNTSVG